MELVYFQHLTVLPTAPACTGSQVCISYSTTRGHSLHCGPVVTHLNSRTTSQPSLHW